MATGVPAASCWRGNPPSTNRCPFSHPELSLDFGLTAYFDIYVVVNGCRCVVDFLLKRDAIQFQILNTFPRVAEQGQEL